MLCTVAGGHRISHRDGNNIEELQVETGTGALRASSQAALGEETT